MINTGSTQPSKPASPRNRGIAILLTILIVILVLALTVFAGYQSGISVRRQNQSAMLAQQLTEQFQFVNDDIKAGHYEIARQRLEFILVNDPGFPGAQEKLTEVLVLMNAPTPTLTPSLTPTPDFSGAQEAYSKAQQLIAAQDWQNALSTLDQLRKLDSTYQQSQVDGMYYFALRNYGYDLIIKQGNLEGGIYQLTLAERFGPLDRDANGLREGARIYIIGASFWDLNWEQAVFYFTQALNWGNLWDGTMTASERYWFASMRYGDVLYDGKKFCDAVTQYQNAQTIAPLDKTAGKNFADAYIECFPPTETPAPATETPTLPAPTTYP